MITKCPHGIYIVTQRCEQCFPNEVAQAAWQERAGNAFLSARGNREPQNAQEATDALEAFLDIDDLQNKRERPTIPS